MFLKSHQGFNVQRKTHYNEILDSDENISTSVPRDRLEMLEASDFISKGKDDVKIPRIEYCPTKKGLDMPPILIDMAVRGGSYNDKSDAGKVFLAQAAKNRANLISSIREKLKKGTIFKLADC